MRGGKKPATIHESEIDGFQGICGWVKELLNPKTCNISNLDLALITIDPGKASQPHYHLKIEEVYYILAGNGTVTIGDFNAHIKAGHAVYIPCGKPHMIANSSGVPLVILAINAPPYDPDDVRLTNSG